MLESPQHINQNVSIWLVLQSVVNNYNIIIVFCVWSMPKKEDKNNTTKKLSQGS